MCDAQIYHNSGLNYVWVTSHNAEWSLLTLWFWSYEKVIAVKLSSGIKKNSGDCFLVGQARFFVCKPQTVLKGL